MKQLSAFPVDDPRVAKSRYQSDMAIAGQVSGVIENILGAGDSVMRPGTQIWTAETAEALQELVTNPAASEFEGPQREWLASQLVGASDEVILLAAEIVFLREHGLHGARPETRTKHVAQILDRLVPPLPIPAPVQVWLKREAKTGGFTTGPMYNGQLTKQIVWVTNFVKHWHQLSEGARNAARENPWLLQQEMLTAGPDSSEVRNAFQFLARPEVFEPISSTDMKRKIRAGLVKLIDSVSGQDPASLDQDLFAIRAQLAQSKNRPFHFWSSGVETLWDPSKESSPQAEEHKLPPSGRPRRSWLYSPGAQAVRWDEFREQGIMAIDLDQLGDLKKYQDPQQIQDALDPDQSGPYRKNTVLAAWQFQKEIQPGDIVYVKRGREEILGRGIVQDGAWFDDSRATFKNTRPVLWTHSGSWTYPETAVTKALTDITRFLQTLETLEQLITGGVEDDTASITPAAVAYTKEDYLAEVYVDESDYERKVALLKRKKNLILSGPPGVGKTYAAKRLAHAVMGQQDDSRVLTVQFHQSYSYEDFMMGYRPTPEGGFALVEGPFYRFCEKARNDPERPHFFIIDEINRGNVSKIFGELLMLIEADKRGQELRLLYRKETFSVPENVYIIGLMNTADRSLATLDYALRRRFGFSSVQPGFDTAGFARHRKKLNLPALDKLIRVVTALNSAIEKDPALGDGFAIGHSYFSSPVHGKPTDAWLQSIVNEELIPLLEEYWFDERATVQDWKAKLQGALT